MRGYKDCIPPFNGSEHLGRLAFEFSNIREFHKFSRGCKSEHSLMCDGNEVKEPYFAMPWRETGVSNNCLN